MRKNLYIIGAHGFGREIASSFRLWDGLLDRYVIKGFLDDKADALEGFQGYPPILSSVENYQPGDNDVFVCGLGAVEWRNKYIDIMLQKKAMFDTFIHPRATVLGTAEIGMGCLVFDNTTISADVSVGDFVLMHSNVTLGHDTRVGNRSVLENGVFAGGGVEIGAGATIHTRSLIVPHQKIGDGAVVGAGSVVIRNVKPGATVFGNPAQRIDR